MAREENDFYPTPKEVVQAIWSWLERDGLLSHLHRGDLVLEPGVGEGAFIEHAPDSIKRLVEFVGVDLVYKDSPAFSEDNVCFVEGNFLSGEAADICEKLGPFRLVIGNPPFLLAEAFVRRSLQLSTGPVVLLLRSAFLESKQRLDLFKAHLPRHIYFLSERPAFKTGSDKTDKYAYAVFVWMPQAVLSNTFSVESWKREEPKKKRKA